MKSRRLITPAVAALLTAIALSGALPAHAQRGSVTMPAHPKQLLDTLPKVRQGWKVTKSEGKSEYTTRIIARVQRNFEKVVLAEEDDPSRPPRTEIRILDGGQFPGSVSQYDNFEPDEESEPKKMFIGSFPAFVYDRGMSGFEVRLLASNRYVAVVTLHMQPPTELGKWLESIDFRALATIGGTPITSYPSKIKTVFIDELNPENNRELTETRSDGGANKLLSAFLKASGISVTSSDALPDPPPEPAPAAPAAPKP